MFSTKRHGQPISRLPNKSDALPMHPSTMTIGLVSLICCSPVMYYLLASRLLLLTRTKFPPYFLQLLFIDLIFFEPNQTLCILPLWVIFVNDCQTSVTFKCEEQNPAIASNVSLLTRPNVSLSTRQKSVQPLLGSSGHRYSTFDACH